jgi:uncharacterized protein YpiB (UPF0302 family)
MSCSPAFSKHAKVYIIICFNNAKSREKNKIFHPLLLNITTPMHITVHRKEGYEKIQRILAAESSQKK